ncbi:MAG: hypothetical protein ABI268_09905 [Rhodanobacter sp.]
MEAADYDIALAESVLMMAHAAMGTGPQLAAHRLAVFPRVVDQLDKSVMEVKRGRVKQVSALAEAMDVVRVLVRREIDDALAKHSRIFSAARGVRDNMKLDATDSPYLWRPSVPDTEFSAAVDRLFTVLLETE